MQFLLFLIVCIFFLTRSCSLVLPEIPEASPTTTPISPSPSATAPISPPPSTTAPISPLPSTQPTVAATPAGSTFPRPSPFPEPTLSSLPTTIAPATTTAPLVSASPKPSRTPQSGSSCMRNTAFPSPYLGTSPELYTFAVILVFVCIAIASVLYKAALDSEQTVSHTALRFSAILLARFLLIIATKLSAAFVATTANAKPGDPLDGALDASGAFLTWVSAIFTSFYYEALRMTLFAVGFYRHESEWGKELNQYLSPLYHRNIQSEDQTRSESGFDTVPSAHALRRRVRSLRRLREPSLENSINSGLLHEENRERVQDLTIAQRFTGGRIDRKLLMLAAFLFMISELTALSINLEQLVSYLTNRNPVKFLSPEDAGQCGICSDDVQLLAGLTIVQVVYYLCNQPSLVLLLIFAAMPPSEGGTCTGRVLNRFRKFIGFVLLLWTISFLCLPIFLRPLEPYFIVGDLSLFWFVILTPPSYKTVHYIITAVYTVCAMIIGLFVLYGLSRDSHYRHQHTEEPIRSLT